MLKPLKPSKLSLVIGGAVSGKSEFAETLCQHSGSDKIYLATSQAFDGEMQVKIDRHIESRGAGWVTIEEPLDLCPQIERAGQGTIILLECATMWINNLMYHKCDIMLEVERLIQTIVNAEASVIVVSNEVGQGIVPSDSLSREFCHLQGMFNQKLAGHADDVFLVCAGLPIKLKPSDLCALY